MIFNINGSIKSQLKQSYAQEGEDYMEDIEIDCSEGINTICFSDVAIEAFNNIEYTIMRDYPHSLSVKESVIDFWGEHINANLEVDNIFLCDGSVNGLYFINRLFLEKDDVVLGYSPQFPEYETDVKMYGAKYKSYKLKEENNYRFIIDEFLPYINGDEKIIYIDNPNNPTGQVIELENIEKISKIALENNVVVVVDEAYGDYMDIENSAIKLCEKYENLMVVRTFSKGYGLAGLRSGYIVMNKDLCSQLNKITNPYSMSAL